jgi:fatty acyl-CoA reductase
LNQIASALEGRRIAITGATGFLGTALVERLIRSVPGCQLVLLVRPGRRGAEERVRREVLRNDCFDRLRSELGDDFDSETSRRVVAISGDVSRDGLGLSPEDAATLASCDVVVHSAAAVAFDSPLDHAVSVNLLGPPQVAEALLSACSQAQSPLPHLISVSTAYVAGNRRGKSREALLTEQTFSSEASWKDEVEAARRIRSDADAASREPRRLQHFDAQARRELGAAGSPLLARRAERIRQDWVADRLVEAGKARAQGLGWPDAYAYTKALGEQALAERHGPLPISIVRPSIIESAMAEPYPGWIRGFRMAEPVIISYARGLLKEFPGIPEGVIDVIPVDLVAAAIVAVAAAGISDGPPDPAKIPVYQVASGSVNPLRYGQLVDLVSGYFTRNPLYDSHGQPIEVPEWSFPGRGRVQRQLVRATSMLASAERAVAKVPFRSFAAPLAARLEEKRAEAKRALTYVELYGSYTETEAVFQVDNLLGLWEKLDPADKESFCFDPRVIDWPTYVHEVHLPSVVEHARQRTAPGRRSGSSRYERGRQAVLHPDRRLAVFDLENTLVASNVVEAYAWLATHDLPLSERLRFTVSLLGEAPRLSSLDRHDRGDFLRHFYRHYKGADLADLQARSHEMLSGLLLTRAFPAGLRRVREHRAAGHITMLITGALDFVVEPLRPLFDEVVAASMRVDRGVLTGELERHPPTGEARAQIIEEFAASRGFSLAECVSYADSSSDLPMLEIVGFPVAVNPDARLASMARRRGWHTESWQPAPGGARSILPLASGPHREEAASVQLRELLMRAQRASSLLSAHWQHRRERVER